jgi:hypothetical protein
VKKHINLTTICAIILSFLVISATVLAVVSYLDQTNTLTCPITGYSSCSVKLYRNGNVYNTLTISPGSTFKAELYGNCQARYTGNLQCSGNYIQKEYKNTDCSLTWKNYQYCTYGCENSVCKPKPTTTTTTTTPPITCTDHSQCSQKCTSLCPSNVYGCCNGCNIGQCVSGVCQCVNAASYCSNSPPYQVGTQCTIPNPNDFFIQYLGYAKSTDITITTTDGNPVTYPSLVPGTTLPSINWIQINGNKKSDVVFAMTNFQATSDPALCPTTNVIGVPETWEYQIWKSSTGWSSWASVVNPQWGNAYLTRGIYLGQINPSETWYINLRGNIPSVCLGTYNLNTNNNYVFLISNATTV